MTSWNKNNALEKLMSLSKEVVQLRQSKAYSTEHTRWLLKTLEFLQQVFGHNSMYYLSIKGLNWQYKGSVYGNLIHKIQTELARKHHQAYLEQLDVAQGVLEAAYDALSHSTLESVYDGKNTAPEISELLKVINLAEHKLRKIIRDTPMRERDIQDAFENLLIGAEIDYSREKENIEYSSKAYIPDFTLPKIDLAIDMKFCAREGREKEIIGELNDYTMAFQTKYGNILFVVYDMGFIRDVEKFREEFEKNHNVIVKVVKH